MAARGQVARGQGAKRGGHGSLPRARGQLVRGPPCVKRATRPREEAKRESFVQRTYIVGGVEVKKLNFLKDFIYF